MVGRDIYLLRRSEEFHLDPGQEASINLKLEKAPPPPRTLLYGQVVSSCAKIPGATVKVLGMDSIPVCHTETNRNGEYMFVNTLIPGDYEIIASARGYLVSESRVISLKPSAHLYLAIKLNLDKNAENAAVYGTVRNSENIPLSSAQVCIFSSENMECEANVAVTNADGEYLFTGLKPGKYVMSASCHGYTLPEKITVEVCPRDMFRADLYLYKNISEEKGTVSGVVLHDGHTVPYAVTALYREESGGYCLIQIQQANSSGVYLFSDLSAGTYIVRAKLESS